MAEPPSSSQLASVRKTDVCRTAARLVFGDLLPLPWDPFRAKASSTDDAKKEGNEDPKKDGVKLVYKRW